MSSSAAAMFLSFAGPFAATLLLAPLLLAGAARARGAGQLSDIRTSSWRSTRARPHIRTQQGLALLGGLGLAMLISGHADLLSLHPTPLAVLIALAWTVVLPVAVASLPSAHMLNVYVVATTGLCLMVLGSVTGQQQVALVAAGAAGAIAGFIPIRFANPAVRPDDAVTLSLGLVLTLSSLRLDATALGPRLSVGLSLVVLAGAAAVGYRRHREALGRHLAARLSAAVVLIKPALLWTRTPYGLVVVSLLWTVALAISMNLLLETAQSATIPANLQEPTDPTSILFALSAFVLWFLIAGLLALTGRLWITTAVTVSLVGALAAAHQEKYNLRLEPLFPTEWGTAIQVPFLVEMVGGRALAWAATGIIVALGCAALLGRWLSRWYALPRGLDQRFARRLLVARGGATVAAAAALAYAANFNEPDNLLRKAFTASGAEWVPWHQAENYGRNGFIAGTLYNMPVPAMEAPDAYDESTMAALTAKYAAEADAVNVGRAADALKDVNVVVVLSETFADPLRMKGVQFATDPIPYTRELMRRTASGNMLTSAYGGGTANVEFEALTGMSVAQFQPQMHTPFQMLVPRQSDFPSAASIFKEEGHSSVAIHAYTTALYRRADVYPALGFDKAIFDDDMQHQARVERNPFISDQALYDEVLHHLQATAQPLFINAVSMQNHGPYRDRHDEPIEATGNLPASALAEASQYARGLRHSDEALRRFIKQVDDMDEDTIVLFYGDHLASFWPEPVRQATGARLLHETPFFVYSNYKQHTGGTYGTLSPIYFTNLILEEADAQLSPYHVLLRRLAQNLPGISRRILIGPDDMLIREDQLSPAAREVLRDYRLALYDLTVGEGYAREELFRMSSSATPSRALRPAEYQRSPG
jgi:phosphoglycerol transferase MdoB-like AlkP superfamily enzyme